MAVVADRVIVELEAKLDRYEANVRRAEAKFDSATRKISSDAKRMARDIEANSAQAGNAIRGLAGTFAAAFSVQQVASLADGYTRFTNQLKVAGLEGQNLAAVQERLFGLAQKNGVELESLGRLYGGLASLQKDLGTSSRDSIALVTAVSESIRVGGTSAETAKGAILGLNQALAQTRVQSDEYNQILDGARPLLQAAVNGSDKYRGSLARLKQDIEAGKVSGQDLFRILSGGFPTLAAQAEKANLTIANSFTTLNNALGKYIGETDASLSATERISAAIISLSKNLDTVATALALIGAVMLGRFVAGMVAGTASTGLATTALFALQARAAGAATTMEALALTGATAGRTLLAAFGGPVGVAVTALALGIGYLATESAHAADVSKDYADNQETLRRVQEGAATATDKLATATGQQRVEALQAVVAIRTLTQTYYELAKAALVAARAREAQAKASRPSAAPSGSAVGVIGRATRALKNAILPGRTATEEVNTDAQAATVAGFEAELARLDKQIAEGAKPRKAPAATPGKTKKTKKGPKGTDPAAAARRFIDDLSRGQLDLMGAEAEVIGTLEARRFVERTRVEADRLATARNINADKDLSGAQKAQLLTLNDLIAAQKNALLDAEKRQQDAEEFRALVASDLENERDLLDANASLAKSTDERRAIALRLLEIQKEQERLQLEAVAASRTATDAEKAIANRRLAMLDELYGARGEKVEKDNQGPLADWADKFDKTPGEIRDQIEGLVVDELESVRTGINNAITKTLGIKDPLIAGLLQILLDDILFKPIAEALKGASSGGGGIIGTALSVVGSIFGFGRASGGHVVGGQMYRVNEGGRGAEGFRPSGSGQIIPLGRMRGAQTAGPMIYQTVNVDARGVNPDGFAEHIRQVVRQDTIKIVGTGMRAVTAGVPGRLQQYDRDGR